MRIEHLEISVAIERDPSLSGRNPPRDVIFGSTEVILLLLASLQK
jgi:hypothetical protein